MVVPEFRGALLSLPVMLILTGDAVRVDSGETQKNAFRGFFGGPSDNFFRESEAAIVNSDPRK